MLNIATTYSTHNSCFVCREKNRSLHRVRKQDILHAYTQHRILITKDARVCDAHFGDNGLIRKEEFFVIPTFQKAQTIQTVKMFDILASNVSSMFEPFKEMKYLENEHCLKITGWTKKQFEEFSCFITSINHTKNRTREELIAIYRYWLRTGIQQNSLAAIYGNNTKKIHICKYLDQIREAMYKNFVPYFLGANKSRDFFLEKNTVMTTTLFDLKEDELVLTADGSYSRIEKSANNDFQYKTYSKQKNGSLFKPFLICCADGYIIDCYGPFQANANDATILDYILEYDEDLKKLLIPHKTVFILDRGTF
jgi:hypothetical protein